MSSRMELNWGEGRCDVLLDLQSGIFFPYDGGEEFHRNLGGKCYYTSLSGLSGAGWIPRSPALRRVESYRPQDGLDLWDDPTRFQPTIGTKLVFVPIVNRWEVCPSRPVLVIDQYNPGERIFLAPGEVLPYLRGELQGLEERVFSLSFIPGPGVAEVQRDFNYLATEDGLRGFRRGLGRAVEAILSQEIAFSWPGDRPESPFWGRLGLYPIGDRVYKVVSGICRRSFSREELSSREGLQAAAPKNVLILNPNCYLQEGNGTFDAVGLFEIDGVEADFEIHLESEDAARALGGDFEEILRSLKEGAENKVRHRREHEVYLRRLAAEQAAQGEAFEELCSEHSELEVTLEDSRSAGNCEVGTKAFRDRSFPGREKASIGELTSYLHRVRGVRGAVLQALLRHGAFPEEMLSSQSPAPPRRRSTRSQFRAPVEETAS